jgi:hypothetical protein
MCCSKLCYSKCGAGGIPSPDRVPELYQGWVCTVELLSMQAQLQHSAWQLQLVLCLLSTTSLLPFLACSLTCHLPVRTCC